MSLTGTVETVGFSTSSETPTPPQDFYAVLYVQQNLSTAQKLQALQNIGALNSDDIATLLAGVDLDPATMILTFTRKNGTSFQFDLSSNEGVEDISLDANNDLQVDYLNGNSSLINLSGLLSNFIHTVNNKVGPHVVLDIDDIEFLREELDARLPNTITVDVDGDVQNLQQNPVFSTNAVKFTPQTPTPTQQQTARENISALSTTPNGTDLLIGTNNKISDTYLPDSLFGQLKWGGTFNASGIISATADFPQLNGTNISALNTVQYKGVYFIASFADSAVLNIHGVEYNNGDWAVANGNTNGFNKADNSDAVTSVAGKRGVVVLDMNDIQGLVSELLLKANTNGNYPNMTVGNATKLNNLSDTDFVKKDGSVPMTGQLKLPGILIDRTEFNSDAATEGKTNLGYWKWGVSVGGDTDKWNVYNLDTDISVLDILANGNVGIGETNPTEKLHVGGNINTNNITTQLSYLNAGVVNDNAGIKLWGGSVVSQYGISVNAVGGMDIMANQDSQPIRFWAGRNNTNPNLIASFEQASANFYKNVVIPNAIASNHAVALGQVNGLVSNGNTAYNERVTQFNTTYTTSLYTFSILLANGVQKQTTLQVNSSHFVINGSGVLQLNAAIAQKINDAATVTQLDGKVDKVAGKQLSTEDYTSAEKTKLNNIAAGAEVNVNADWNATSGDAQILNKPTIPVIPNNLVTTNTTQTISATKDFTVSPTVPYASAPEHPVPYLQMQEYISNRFDAISSYSRDVINTNGSTIGVKEWIKTIVFATNATGTILNPEETLKNGAILNICTQAITAGSIYVNMPVRRLDGSTDSVYSCAQGYSYIFYYNESDGRWEETHGIYNN